MQVFVSSLSAQNQEFKGDGIKIINYLFHHQLPVSSSHGMPPSNSTSQMHSLSC